MSRKLSDTQARQLTGIRQVQNTREQIARHAIAEQRAAVTTAQVACDQADEQIELARKALTEREQQLRATKIVGADAGRLQLLLLRVTDAKQVMHEQEQKKARLIGELNLAEQELQNRQRYAQQQKNRLDNTASLEAKQHRTQRKKRNDC